MFHEIQMANMTHTREGSGGEHTDLQMYIKTVFQIAKTIFIECKYNFINCQSVYLCEQNTHFWPSETQFYL